MQDHTVISSLIVRVLPDHGESAAARLASIEGVEVHEKLEGKIVVTIEAPTVDASHDTAASFSEIPGVIGVDLVYVNFEDDPAVARGSRR